MNQVLKVIEELENNRKIMYLSRDSAEFLADICKKIKPKNVLEIGMYHGYSALWLSLYSQNVTCLEIDKESIKIAEENFRKAGQKNIKIIEGSAVETLKKLKEKFDLILIDAKKSEYGEYLKLILKLLNEGALIFADNTISHKEHMPEFFEYLKNSDLHYKELNLGKGLIIISKSSIP
ncbi:class I SAM-dependent methyltransferase [Candidatus Woesearchaeota archaeon]|nr:class I SAM-dependent methyltransferase [Candidatus Woesearchaeota archaeon]